MKVEGQIFEKIILYKLTQGFKQKHRIAFTLNVCFVTFYVCSIVDQSFILWFWSVSFWSSVFSRHYLTTSKASVWKMWEKCCEISGRQWKMLPVLQIATSFAHCRPWITACTWFLADVLPDLDRGHAHFLLVSGDFWPHSGSLDWYAEVMSLTWMLQNIPPFGHLCAEDYCPAWWWNYCDFPGQHEAYSWQNLLRNWIQYWQT